MQASFQHELGIKPSLNSLLIPPHYSPESNAAANADLADTALPNNSAEPMSPGPSN